MQHFHLGKHFIDLARSIKYFSLSRSFRKISMLANSALYLLIVGHSTIQKGFLTPAAEP